MKNILFATAVLLSFTFDASSASIQKIFGDLSERQLAQYEGHIKLLDDYYLKLNKICDEKKEEIRRKNLYGQFSEINFRPIIDTQQILSQQYKKYHLNLDRMIKLKADHVISSTSFMDEFSILTFSTLGDIAETAVVLFKILEYPNKHLNTSHRKFQFY